MTPKDQPPTPERIMQLTWGYAAPLMIDTAISLGVFDALDVEPRNLRELAEATESSERGLRALCNGLVGLELLARDGSRYTLSTDTATFLVRGKPGFRGQLVRHAAGQMMGNWMKLTEAVRTGEPVTPVNQQDAGAPFFQQFVESLFNNNYEAARGLAHALKVADATEPLRVLDLAAGSGVWGIAFAERSDQVRVTAVDWAEVIPVTQRVVERNNVTERFTFVEGDLMEVDLGEDHAVAILGHILHSEGAERSRALLRRVHDALAPGGTIAIAEFTPDDDRAGPPMPLLFAINMLVHTEAGDTFTFAELSDWLTDAGFTEPRRLEVPAPSPLILATRP